MDNRLELVMNIWDGYFAKQLPMYKAEYVDYISGTGIRIYLIDGKFFSSNLAFKLGCIASIFNLVCDVKPLCEQSEKSIIIY